MSKKKSKRRQIATSPPHVPFREALWTWARVAGLSFGGPTAQIAVMHKIIVEEKKWVDEPRFLHALNYCMLLPGPEAQQLAVYIGWLMHGTRGGIAAGTLFVLPGFVSILLLSILYVQFQQTPAVVALFFGLKAAVLAIVLQAVLRVGGRVLKNRVLLGVAIASFAELFFLQIPFPLVIFAAGLLGLMGGHWRPDLFPAIGGHGKAEDEPAATIAYHAHRPPTILRTLGVLALCLTLWFAPLLWLAWVFGRDSIFVEQGIFFSKAAVVTFGGAYSVLAYVKQQAVERYHWIKPTEMLDGLGLAESTPGPLIMVVQFVAFLGAYHHPETLSPLMAGLLGSVITVWVTFVPSFTWVFLGAPYMERLRSVRLLGSVLSTITAAVVGAIANLALDLSLHTIFRTVHEQYTSLGSSNLRLRWLAPDWSTLSPTAAGIAVVAGLMLFEFKRSLAETLVVSVILGLIASWVMGAG